METAQNKGDARWQRTRQRLLEGGRKVFAEQGVEATSVLDIVRAAGVSQPSFYNHFETKQALALEIATAFFREDRKAKRVIFDSIDDPAEAIAINIQQTLAIAQDDPVIAWVLVKSDKLRELVVSSSRDPLAEMITTGAEAGRFVVSDSHTVALVIRGAALAVIQGMLNGTADENAGRVFQELVLRMLGLNPEESAAVVTRALARNALDAVA
jgi:AcrR family transcriptional regulator